MQGTFDAGYLNKIGLLSYGGHFTSIDISGCGIQFALDKELNFAGTADFTDCFNLLRLPNHMTADELLLLNCSSLAELPENLIVGDLWLTGCHSLRKLPMNLLVTRDLVMFDCPSLLYWPPYILDRVNGSIFSDA